MINYSIYIACKKPGTKKADYNTVGTMAYGSAQMNEKLSFDQFCKHIADHNSPFSKGTIRQQDSAGRPRHLRRGTGLQPRQDD